MENRKNDFYAACCFAVAILLVLIGSLTTQPVQAQVRRALTAGVYEGESLVTSGKILVNGGKVVSQPMDGFGQGWSGNAQLFWGGGQTGAVLDLILDVPTEGIYAVELHMTRAPDYGRLRVQVAGKDADEIFDGYAPTVVPSGPVPIGTFYLEPGHRNVSFMIVGKNEKATGFLAGIDFVRLTKKPVLPSITQKTATGAERWEITGLSVSPPTTHISDKEMGYLDGDKLTVKCSYKMFEEGQDSGVQLLIFDNASLKDTTGITAWQGGTRTFSYKISGPGIHNISCKVVVVYKPDQSKVTDEKAVFINVKGNQPSQGGWINSPIIVKPAQNEKMSGGSLVVKPHEPSQSHCSDGGSFSLEWQYMENPISGWKPMDRKLSSLWKCVPEGSTKDLSGMKAGLYKVRAKETNSKHNFASSWSEWVTFELLPPK